VSLVKAVFTLIDTMEGGKITLRPEVHYVSPTHTEHADDDSIDHEKVEGCQRGARQGTGQGCHGGKASGG
jgi:hypothetical protein